MSISLYADILLAARTGRSIFCSGGRHQHGSSSRPLSMWPRTSRAGTLEIKRKVYRLYGSNFVKNDFLRSLFVTSYMHGYVFLSSCVTPSVDHKSFIRWWCCIVSVEQWTCSGRRKREGWQGWFMMTYSVNFHSTLITTCFRTDLVHLSQASCSTSGLEAFWEQREGIRNGWYMMRYNENNYSVPTTTFLDPMYFC
jgi:hypothetical protein